MSFNSSTSLINIPQSDQEPIQIGHNVSHESNGHISYEYQQQSHVHHLLQYTPQLHGMKQFSKHSGEATTNFYTPHVSIIGDKGAADYSNSDIGIKLDMKTKNDHQTHFENFTCKTDRHEHNDNLIKEENSTLPNHYMNLFIDEFLITLLVDGTNWYLDNFPKNRKDRIPSVTSDEIRCVLAILYLSGYVHLPRVRMFWERAPDTSFPLVVNAIPRDRFETIFTNLHAAGSSVSDKKDPLSRINTLVVNLRDKFFQYAPSEDTHSIDELSVPYYKQATGLRQFTKTKSMNLWCGCTSSGYCTWFDQIEEIQAESPATDTNMAVNKIFTYAAKMSSFKLGKPSLIYDNLFNSIRLVDELRQLEIEPRPVPNRISMAMSKSQKNTTILHKSKEQSKVHNSPMGGIDKLDQNINLYAITVIGKKWTSHFLLAYVLDLAIQNAWQLYRLKNNSNALDLLGFRRSIVTYYLTKYAKPVTSKVAGNMKRFINRAKKQGNIVEIPIMKTHSYRYKDIRYDGIEHYVISQDKQTRCFHCKMKTMTRCRKCDVGLHVKCFIEYHTRNIIDNAKTKCDISNNLNETSKNLIVLEKT